MERIPATFSAFDGKATGAVLLLALLTFACQGQPIPLAAAQGSSVMIPIGGGGLVFGEGPLMGYGSDTLDDWQRGRLRLWLDADPDDVELPVRGVARVSADRASPAGLSQSAHNWELADQVVVVVDVPIDAPLGPWPIYARRYMQQWDGSSWQEQELPAAQAPSYHGALEVLPEVGSPTPLAAFLFGYWQPVAPNVADLVPHPKFRFVVQESPSTPLGAVRFTVTYPASRLAIQGVVAEPIDGDTTDWGRSALISFSEAPPGVLDVRCVAPGGVYGPAFAIVFALAPPTTPPAPGWAPASTTDFTISAIEAWDVSGTARSASVPAATKKIF